jgi:hypothetical protein
MIARPLQESPEIAAALRPQPPLRSSSMARRSIGCAFGRPTQRAAL